MTLSYFILAIIILAFIDSIWIKSFLIILLICFCVWMDYYRFPNKVDKLVSNRQELINVAIDKDFELWKPYTWFFRTPKSILFIDKYNTGKIKDRYFFTTAHAIYDNLTVDDNYTFKNDCKIYSYTLLYDAVEMKHRLIDTSDLKILLTKGMQSLDYVKNGEHWFDNQLSVFMVKEIKSYYITDFFGQQVDVSYLVNSGKYNEGKNASSLINKTPYMLTDTDYNALMFTIKINEYDNCILPQQFNDHNVKYLESIYNGFTNSFVDYYIATIKTKQNKDTIIQFTLKHLQDTNIEIDKSETGEVLIME